MSKIIMVSVLMVATSEGYYKNRIIRVGEQFLYEGGLNRKNELPLWAEPVDAEAAEKAVEAALKKAKGVASAPEAPKAPQAPVVPPAAPEAPVVPGVVKPLTKAELVAKLVAAGKVEADIKNLKVDELRALDAQSSAPSLQSVM